MLQDGIPGGSQANAAGQDRLTEPERLPESSGFVRPVQESELKSWRTLPLCVLIFEHRRAVLSFGFQWICASSFSGSLLRRKETDVIFRPFLHATVNRVCCLFTVALLLPVFPCLAATPTPEQLAFFENDIRPLLVKHCYDCHSGAGKQEGELRVDGHGFLLQGGASGPAIVSGDPKTSLMIEAVQYRSLEMPPNGKLPQTEVDKLVRWIEMGAPWPEEEQNPVAGGPSKKFELTEEQLSHWAFQPVASPAPPAVADVAWAGNPVDQFLFDSMQKHGVQPNGLADRAVLLRRVTYDLTGLPPSVEELHDYLADESPEAWSKVIERLLASPHYGERWGRHWMDVIRYADTAGDASDYPLPDAYKYRNYIIRSINNDKPYDQFLREQYAGDLLAKTAPAEQFEELTTATTHLALSRRFGYNDTNFLYFHLTIQDLLDTMGQSVLGLSIGCARCHDHKFEPISARDYYALYGIFSSSKFTFPGAEEIRYPKDLVPAVSPEEVSKKQQARNTQTAELNRLIQESELPVINLEGDFESDGKFPAAWKHDTEAKIVSNSSSPWTNIFPVGTKSVQLPNDARNLGIRRALSTYTVSTQEPLFFSLDFRNVSIDAGGEGYYRIALDHPENHFSAAVELFVNGTQFAVRDGDGMKTIAPMRLGQWYQLQVEVNWPAKVFSGVLTSESDCWKFESIPFNPTWDGIVNSWVVDGWGTDSTKVRPSRELDNFCAQNIPFLPAHQSASLTPADIQEKLATLRPALEQAQAKLAELNARPLYPVVYGVQEGDAANARIQLRGEPERLGEEAPRAFLEVLGGSRLPADCKESGRRELADWLTSPTNPLTARVMVNRIWLYHFGRGIVATPNDFGIRGELPTHPELLDFLATSFREQGYSLKAMHRLILNSRAYQLSSDLDSPAETIDPVNQWFWRHNRQRLDAESLRDTWLALSGELDLTMGGPHPFPPVSAWAYSQHNPFDAVYDSRLRTVYLMTQRIKRHPFLSLFDGADPNTTTGKRESTITPSQALFMMNDDFMHQRSTAFAQRLIRECPSEDEQIIRLYESAYARHPSDQELQQSRQFLQRYSLKIPEGADRTVLSLAAYLRVILSSNEFLYLN